jgi:signal transduction histidine kinase
MGADTHSPPASGLLPSAADRYAEENARLREALREARQMLTELRQTLADTQRLTRTGDWVIDPIGGGASASAEGYRILGLPGKTHCAHFMECLTHVHPDDLPAVLAGFQDSVATGEPRPLHYRIIGPGSAETDVETVAQPVRDDEGRVVRVIGTVMDVTERNRTQNALRASEKLARGQAGAMMRTLEALVQETSPDRLPEVMLRTIAQEFGAAAITVWLAEPGSRRAWFAYQFMDDRLLSADDGALLAAHSPPHPRDQRIWRDILQSRRCEVVADIGASTAVPLREYNLSHGLVTMLFVPMLIAAEVDGLIAIGFRQRRDLQPAELALAQALANQTMLAIRLTQLSERSRLAAVSAERTRVMRDVHDTLAHAFTGVIVQLEAADDAAARGLGAEAGAHVARAESMARLGLQEARRSVMALRPQALEGSDLPTALNELVTRTTGGTALAATFSTVGTIRPLPAALDEHLLRVGQEALTNAVRHGAAASLSMTLSFDAGQVRLDVFDDGTGFDPGAPTEGLGLAGIRARVTGMGGQLHLRSGIDDGTTVSVIVPLPSPAPAP